MIDIFFLMIRRPPRSTLDRSSAASDVYKRQAMIYGLGWPNWLRLGIWMLIGVVIYFAYGRHHSKLNQKDATES